MKRYVNVCADGRGSFLFGQLWPSENEARQEARYLFPIPIAVGVSVEINHYERTVQSAIRALARVGECK